MSKHETNLPRAAQEHTGERESQRVVLARFPEPPFLVRFDPPPDYGADGSIELQRVVPGIQEPLPTGRRAWFQLKHTSSPECLADGSISYPIDTKNINYLGNHSCPFYVLYIRPTGELFFRWWRDVRGELDRDRPGWNQQHEVRIRFSRRVDNPLLREIEIELDAYWERSLEFYDGPYLLRFLQVEQARRSLQPDTLFVGRQKEMDALIRRMARGNVVPIVGAPDAGKSELVRQCLCEPTALERLGTVLGTPLALLHVDVRRHMAPRLLRGLAFALGVHKIRQIEPDETTRQARERALLLGEEFPARVRGQYLVAFIDSAHLCLDQPVECEDLDELLTSEAFRSGCAVLVCRWGAAPNGKGTRTREAELSVGALSPTEAATLMEQLGVDRAAASGAVKSAQELQEVLLPGVIRQGVATFRVGVAEGRLASTSEALVNELLDAIDRVVREILMGLGMNEVQTADGRATPLATLMAMSLLGRQVVRDTDLGRAELPQPPFSELRQVGWVEQLPGQGYQLTGFGCRSLRQEFQRWVRREPPALGGLRTVVRALEQLVDVIGRRTGEDRFDEFGQTLEEAVAWAREGGLGGSQVEAVLFRALLPYVVDDVFFPILVEEAEAVREELRTVERPGDLASAAAELVLAARSDVDAAQLLDRLRAAVDAAAQAPLLLAIHLRALDVAALLGQRRHHRYREILAIRRALLNRLLRLNDVEAADVAVLKWSVSWILNTAALAVALGEITLARQTADAARTAVGRLPAPRTSYGATDRLWLESRVAQVESRLQPNTSERATKLREALDAAFAALASTPGAARWVRFAIRAAHRLSEELRTEEERERLLDDTYERLTTIFGAPSGWPLGVRAQAAALARDIAALDADPDRRLQQVQRPLGLLEPAAPEALSLARLGDSRPLLVLARSYAFAGTSYDEIGEVGSASDCRRKALLLTREAHDAAPSADGWELHLRLIDQQESPGLEAAWHTDALGRPRSRIGPDLRDNMKAARAWLNSMSFWDGEEGRLALWCLQREWQSEGSLVRWAAATQGPNGPWDEMDPVTKRRALARKHRERQGALDAIERKSGPILDIYLARMWNEAQFQRLLAIYGNHVVDNSTVFRHLDAAKTLWPDNHALSAEEGRYQRYVWNYPAAIVALRYVVAAAPRGRQRREAAADLVEVLLTASKHCEQIEFDDGSTAGGASLVAEARTLLSELLGFRHVSREGGMLRDWADLEAGVSLDWRALDEAFHRVVGDVDAYATTLVGNLDELRAREPDLPERLADLVLTHYTSAEVLRGLGSLYVRRAELGVSPDPAADCRKAYAAFLACRVLEIAWSGSRKESATTSYQRGRAILAAANITGKLTPFNAHFEGRRSLVHLAETLFSRAVGLTVGLFHAEAKRRQSEAARLQRLLSR